jgi:hypothetical protein
LWVLVAEAELQWRTVWRFSDSGFGVKGSGFCHRVRLIDAKNAVYFCLAHFSVSVDQGPDALIPPELFLHPCLFAGGHPCCSLPFGSAKPR